MSMPFYVAPEQLMQDRADYARKGIARGRSVVVLGYDDGIAFATHNPSRALHKISEIYDRIGFAGVGKYNEFENLRVAGIRYADLRGYSYDRHDVSARGLANSYAQTLGTVFTTEAKPLEVELVVAEVGTNSAQDQIYRLSYDGTVAEERDFVVIGGDTDTLSSKLEAHWRPELPLGEALNLAVDVLREPRTRQATGTQGEGDRLGSAELEVAVLDRTRERRTFTRVQGAVLEEFLTPAS